MFFVFFWVDDRLLRIVHRHHGFQAYILAIASGSYTAESSTFSGYRLTSVAKQSQENPAHSATTVLAEVIWSSWDRRHLEALPQGWRESLGAWAECGPGAWQKKGVQLVAPCQATNFLSIVEAHHRLSSFKGLQRSQWGLSKGGPQVSQMKHGHTSLKLNR